MIDCGLLVTDQLPFISDPGFPASMKKTHDSLMPYESFGCWYPSAPRQAIPPVVLLAGALARAGWRVGVVDLDPECQVSRQLLPSGIKCATVADVIHGGLAIGEAYTPSTVENLWILPGHPDVLGNGLASRQIDVKSAMILSALMYERRWTETLPVEVAFFHCPPGVNAFSSVTGEVLSNALVFKGPGDGDPQVESMLRQLVDTNSEMSVYGVINSQQIPDTKSPRSDDVTLPNDERELWGLAALEVIPEFGAQFTRPLPCLIEYEASSEQPDSAWESVIAVAREFTQRLSRAEWNLEGVDEGLEIAPPLWDSIGAERAKDSFDWLGERKLPLGRKLRPFAREDQRYVHVSNQLRIPLELREQLVTWVLDDLECDMGLCADALRASPDVGGDLIVSAESIYQQWRDEAIRIFNSEFGTESGGVSPEEYLSENLAHDESLFIAIVTFHALRLLASEYSGDPSFLRRHTPSVGDIVCRKVRLDTVAMDGRRACITHAEIFDKAV